MENEIDKWERIWKFDRYSAISSPHVYCNIFNFFSSKDVKSILDIGCGNLYSVDFDDLKTFSFYVGIDIALTPLLQAKESIKEKNANHLIELIQADARYLPIRSKSFDSCLMISLLPLLGSRYSLAFEEALRVSRGYLAFNLTHKESFEIFLTKNPNIEAKITENGCGWIIEIKKDNGKEEKFCSDEEKVNNLLQKYGLEGEIEIEYDAEHYWYGIPVGEKWKQWIWIKVKKY